MRLLARCVAILLALSAATTLPAQTYTFGAPVGLTNARYGSQPGTPAMATNGKDFLLFWATSENVRVSRYDAAAIAGAKNSGAVALSTTAGKDAVAVWTGAHFLVAATYRDASGNFSVVGRNVTAAGLPLAEQFTMATNAADPRLAFNGTHVLLVTRDTNTTLIQSQLLTPGGNSAGSAAAVSSITGSASVGLALASNGASFVLTVALPHGIEVVALTPAGSFVSRTFISGALQALESGDRFSAVVADGSGYAVAWRESLGLVASFVGGDGTAGSTLVLDQQMVGRASLVRVDADDFAFLYPATAGGRSEVRLLRMSRSGVIRSRDVVAETSGAAEVSLALAGKRLVMAWRDDGQAIFAREAGRPYTVALSFGAAEQRLSATASNRDQMLVLWSESIGVRRALHGGVRTSVGGWSERMLGRDVNAILAAAATNSFAVITANDDGLSAMRLTIDGAIVGPATPITTFAPTAIASDGVDFALAGLNANGEVVVASLKADGTLSAPAIIRTKSFVVSLGSPAIAWDGQQYLAGWVAVPSMTCIGEVPCAPLSNIEVTRLAKSLQRLDPAPVTVAFAQPTPVTIGLAWDGTHSVVVWSPHDRTVLARRITRSNMLDANITTLLTMPAGTTLVLGDVTGVAGGAAIAWRERNASSPDAPRDRVGIVAGGNITNASTVAYDGRATTSPRLAPLGSGVAVLSTAVQPKPPFHGATRVMMTFGGPALSSTPGEPVASIRMVEPARLEISWTAPPQQIRGYRVEARINEGSWDEVEEWFEAGERSVTLYASRPGYQYSFRVRAINDAGASGYSNEVSMYVGRRRSVR